MTSSIENTTEPTSMVRSSRIIITDTMNGGIVIPIARTLTDMTKKVNTICNPRQNICKSDN